MGWRDVRIVLCLGAVAVCLYFLSRNDVHAYAAENGIIELLQLAIIAAFAIVYGYAALKQVGALHSAAIAIALLGVAFFVRELDFKFAADSPLLSTLTRGGWRDGIFFSFIAIVIVYCYQQRRYFGQWMTLALRVSSWPFAAGLGFLLLGHVLDDLWVNNDDRRFWEELAELVGFSLFLVAAIRHHGLSVDDGANPPMIAE